MCLHAAYKIFLCLLEQPDTAVVAQPTEWVYPFVQPIADHGCALEISLSIHKFSLNWTGQTLQEVK